LEIPIEISKDLPELEKMAKERKWEDAPHAMSEMRNLLVHPNPKNKGKFKSAYSDTWKLELWYLELSLLKLCGYSGTYRNRLTGKIEYVPWVK